MNTSNWKSISFRKFQAQRRYEIPSQTCNEATHVSGIGSVYSKKRQRLLPFWNQKWWWKMDSNHRSRWQQIYSLPPLAAREFHHSVIGAGRGSRTPMTSLEGWCTAVMPYPQNISRRNWYRRWDLNPHSLGELGPEPSASANSATSAFFNAS